MKDNQKVKVKYPDGKNAHIVTIKELRERFSDEHPSWVSRFFEELEKTGTSYSRFGTYTLDK